MAPAATSCSHVGRPPDRCQPRIRWLGKSLRPPGLREREDVLDVGHRRGGGSDDGRIERPPGGGQQEERRDAARRLEAARAKVVVRDPVPGRVGQEAEPDRAGARAREGADEAAGGDVEGDDHARSGVVVP